MKKLRREHPAGRFFASGMGYFILKKIIKFLFDILHVEFIIKLGPNIAFGEFCFRIITGSLYGIAREMPVLQGR